MSELTEEEYDRLQEVLKRRATELKNEREEKARKYEAFINEKLKVDLRKTMLEREKIYQQISAYLEVHSVFTPAHSTGQKCHCALARIWREIVKDADKFGQRVFCASYNTRLIP
jgi:hypothetical protein